MKQHGDVIQHVNVKHIVNITTVQIKGGLVKRTRVKWTNNVDNKPEMKRIRAAGCPAKA